MKAFEINVGNPSFSLHAHYSLYLFLCCFQFPFSGIPFSPLSALTFTLPQTHTCPLPVVSDLLEGHVLPEAFGVNPF